MRLRGAMPPCPELFRKTLSGYPAAIRPGEALSAQAERQGDDSRGRLSCQAGPEGLSCPELGEPEG